MKIFFFFVLLSHSLFSIELENIYTVGDIVERDNRAFVACENGDCSKQLESFNDYGIHISLNEINEVNSPLFNDLKDCYLQINQSSCEKIAINYENLSLFKEVMSANNYKDSDIQVSEQVGAQIFNFKGVTMLSGLVLIAIVLLVLSWLSSIFVVVQQKRAVIIEVFGKFFSVKEAGLRLKFPYPFAKIAGTVNLQLMELKIDVNVQSKDKAFLTIPVQVQYKVLNENIKAAFYELNNPEEQIKSYIVNAIRTKGFESSMDDLFKEKKALEDDAMTELSSVFQEYGYEIVNVLVDNPQPSEEIVRAFNRVIASAREKDAAQNEADALMIKLIGEAKAEKESLILKGQAFKAYRSAIAEGNVEAMGLMRGTHIIEEKVTKTETIENEVKVVTEIVTKEIVPNKNPSLVHLTELDILNFFAGVDQREAIRDAAKGNGNTVVVSMANSNGQDDLSKVIALIESLKK